MIVPPMRELSCAGMTIRAQRVPAGYLNERWWPMSVKERVAAMVPPGVSVSVCEDWLPWRLEVVLSESWQRRIVRWLGLEMMSRRSVIARVACELADAPAGLAITTRWA